MARLAGVALVGSVLGLGLDGLIVFGVLVAFSADPDKPGHTWSVAVTERNLAVVPIMGALFVWFWRGLIDLTKPIRMAIAGATLALPLALDQSPSESAKARTLALPCWGWASTTKRPASSLAATLRDANISMPVVLVGLSIGELTTPLCDRVRTLTANHSFDHPGDDPVAWMAAAVTPATATTSPTATTKDLP